MNPGYSQIDTGEPEAESRKPEAESRTLKSVVPGFP
jgi:hypothetical protein